MHIHDIEEMNKSDSMKYSMGTLTLVNSLHGLLNCENGRLDCHGITTEYRTQFMSIVYACNTYFVIH